MKISTDQIKKLREITGAGMMDCKEALTENKGSFDDAVQWLRKKGIAQADRKSGRTTAEGLIGMQVKGNVGALVEVNSETDFVARNDIFQDIVRNISCVAVSHADKEAIKIEEAHYPGTEKTIDDVLKDAVSKIGENLSFRRSACLYEKEGVVAAYMHNALASDMGKLGVLVSIKTSGNLEEAKAFAYKVAMHVAAANPLSITVEDLDPAIVAREKDVFLDQSQKSDKPQNIIEKMVEGRMRKFYEESVLLHQKFVLNQDVSVEEALKDAEKEIGAPAKISGFVRFSLGEGLNKTSE